MAGGWLELTLTESIEALCVAGVPSPRLRSRSTRATWSVARGTWRDQRMGRVSHPWLVVNG